ncbi:MAG TPA: exo-alpha-sialidase [bacterium (Candidatus Stahlbacteria)]|nr:exo-alpha-sialidase [Candidatus Stahlbacteria bacterium]
MRKLLILLIAVLLFADPPWLPNVKVSQDPGSGNQDETTMGVFGGNLVCGGWNDNRQGGTWHVGFARSTDGGQTFQETLMYEPSYPMDCDPCIIISETGDIYYFWLSYDGSYGDIYLTKSTDWGETWQPSICVTAGSPTTLDDKPWAAIDSNNVFVTWYDYRGTYGLKFKRSTDFGQTWPGTGILVGTGGNGTCPIRGTDSLVYVGWGMQDIRFNRSTNMGASWQGQQTAISVVWDPPTTNFRLNNIPSFSTSNDRSIIYVVFSDSRLGANQLDVFFSRSTNQGQTWMTPIKINDNQSSPSIQFYSWLSVDPQDRLHVIWHDSREGGVNDLAQYYAYSTDQGLSWSQNYRVSDTVAYAGTFIGDYNACASDANNVYGLWCDCRNGASNPDIFFSKAPNPVWVEENQIEAKPRKTNMILSFPNPFTNRSQIDYWPRDAQLEIYQQDGRRVKELGARGIYFLILRKDGQLLQKKLVKIE